MTENSVSIGAVTHYKRLSWQHRLAENKPLFIFFLICFMAGMLGGFLAPLIGSVALHHFSLGAYIPMCFIGGLVIGLGLVFCARTVDRKLFGAVKAGIVAIEDRVIAGDSSSQMADLEKLTAGYLKLKRYEAADYYSKKLLELSKTGGTGVMKLSDWVVTTECWVSTKEYHQGWHYKLVWLFETRGVLTLGPSKLDFQSKKVNFTCAPADIVSIEIKRHPLWMKPVPMRYISLTIDEHGVRHTFYLTPSFGQTDTVFDCNRMVDAWYQRLQRIKDAMHPVGSFPDWLKDVQG